MKWDGMFILQLNAAKCTAYIEKCFKQKLPWIKFSVKNSMDALLEWIYGPPKICVFEIL